MALSTAQCQAFNDYLGRRPFDWTKKIAKDRKPSDYIYTGMYKTETWESFTGVTHLHERVYVTRPNDPNLWPQVSNAVCVGQPCQRQINYISHGVDQLRYDRYQVDYQTPVFCIDQLNTIEEAMQKMNAIAAGYMELPENIASDFLRTLTLRKAGTVAQGAGLFLSGLQDSTGNPVAIDINDSMFAVSQGQSLVGSKNTLLINLNANLQLTAQGITTTSSVASNLGQLTMEYLTNIQDDLAGNGYHNKEWLMAGKFSITMDATTRRRLLVANPALTQMYSAADFAKGGAFYSLGVTQGCGDWLFKEDKAQMRFRFRGDMDGKDFGGATLAGAIWIEQVQPFENVAATYGLKPIYSTMWKQAPIRLYHAYHREARTIYVADLRSVNSDMKFGMARSFMGEWKWYSPDFFQAVDPTTGTLCQYPNEKHNQGFWKGEFDLGEETIYPEIERLIIALGEPQPYVRVPRTNAPAQVPTTGLFGDELGYQNVLSYGSGCGTYVNPTFSLPPED